MSCCVANLSGIPRSLSSSWLVWQQTGPSKAISSLAFWRDYWGALAWLPPGRVILPSPPRRVQAAHGLQPCVEQSPEQKEVEAPEAVGLPPNLDLQYKESLLDKQRHLILPIFLDPIFLPNVAKAVFRMAKPLVGSKVLPAARSHKVSSTPPQPRGGGPEQQVLKSKESVPSTSQSTPEVQEQIRRLLVLIQTEPTSPLRGRNCLVDPSRSSFLSNSSSVATRPPRAIPRMVSHPSRYARNQRPMKLGWAPRPGPQRQPSRKLNLNCSKRTSPRSRRFVPGSSNSRREKRLPNRYWTLPPLFI